MIDRSVFDFDFVTHGTHIGQIEELLSEPQTECACYGDFMRLSSDTLAQRTADGVCLLRGFDACHVRATDRRGQQVNRSQYCGTLMFLDIKPLRACMQASVASNVRCLNCEANANRKTARCGVRFR